MSRHLAPVEGRCQHCQDQPANQSIPVILRVGYSREEDGWTREQVCDTCAPLWPIGGVEHRKDRPLDAPELPAYQPRHSTEREAWCDYCGATIGDTACCDQRAEDMRAEALELVA